MARDRHLLLIDDDKCFCELVMEHLGIPKLKVSSAHTRAEGLRICTGSEVDVVLLDQKLPDGEGREICPAIIEHNDSTKIIFSTAYPSFDNAMHAIKSGAYDYISKPVDLDELRLTIERALRTLDLELVENIQNFNNSKENTETRVIGEKGGLAETARLIDLAAASKAPVLLTGETGVGKNIVAKAIHFRGSSKKSAFISVNCAALPENLIEAELFGYEKGAFTGATCSRKGVFEMAEDGTLLLDEIGEMPVHLQAKLLGALEDGKIKRLGGDSIRSVNARVIAATNASLDEAVGRKTFRKDLYYRLNVINIEIPPLRRRKQDIPALCEFILTKTTNRTDIILPTAELDRLMEYDWPGNVRELKNIMERAVILKKGLEVRPSELLLTGERRESESRLAGAAPDTTDRCLTLDEVERKHILKVLEMQSGNITRTAEVLDVSLSTLKRRLNSFKPQSPVQNEPFGS